MDLITHAFATPRPLWFRPSAIAVGWILAQYLEQWMRTGGITGTCGDGVRALICRG